MVFNTFCGSNNGGISTENDVSHLSTHTKFDKIDGIEGHRLYPDIVSSGVYHTVLTTTNPISKCAECCELIKGLCSIEIHVVVYYDHTTIGGHTCDRAEWNLTLTTATESVTVPVNLNNLGGANDNGRPAGSLDEYDRYGGIAVVKLNVEDVFTEEDCKFVIDMKCLSPSGCHDTITAFDILLQRIVFWINTVQDVENQRK